MAQKWGRWNEVRRLEGSAAEAGQGMLFVVVDSSPELSGEYVLKTLKPINNDPERWQHKVARFQREINASKALAEIGVPVVPVIDSAFPERGPGVGGYYVMPLLKKGNLRRLLNEDGDIPGNLGRALPLLGELGASIQMLHRAGGVHRDLKPENVLVGDDGRFVLCDLGLYGRLDGDEDGKRLTFAGEQLGSRHYQAPEALEGRDAVLIPQALDVYSFGKMAYEILSGKQLLGVTQPPEGEHSLARMFGETPVWALLNQLIASLVHQQSSVRLAAWMELDRVLHMVERMESTADGQRSTGDPNRIEALVRARLASDEDVRQVATSAEMWKRRDEYGRRLMDRVYSVMGQDEAVARLMTLYQQNPDTLIVEYRHDEIAGFQRSLGLRPPLEQGLTSTGGAPRLWFLVRGRGEPQVQLQAQLLWGEGRGVQLEMTLAAYESIQDMYRIFDDPPRRLWESAWRPVGDELLVGEAEVVTREMTRAWAAAVERLLEVQAGGSQRGNVGERPQGNMQP